MTSVRFEESIAPAISKWLPWLICSIGAIFYFYEYFLRIAPSVMKVELMSSYHLNGAQFGNLTAFYYYAYAPMQIFVGILMDRYGPRLLLFIACLACAVGTLMFSSPVLAIAMFGRFLVGFGSSFAFVGVLKLASIWLPPERFAMISGMATSLGMMGAITGDLVLNSLVHAAGWRDANLYSAILGIALAVVIVFVVKETSTSMTAEQIKKAPKESLKNIFIGMLEILRTKQIWINGLIGSLLFVPTTAFAELWGPSYLTEARGYSHSQAAFVVTFIFFGWAVGSPIVGWISDQTKQRTLPLAIGSFIAFCFMVGFLLLPNLSPAIMAILFFLFGCFSSAQVIIFAVSREISAKHLSGTAIAVTNMLVMISGIIFQPLIGKLLDYNWGGEIINGARIYSSTNYLCALVVLPLGLLLAAFLSRFVLRETNCKPI